MVLPQTGLLAASGGFAGVEEHAPESLVMRDEAEGSWYSHKQGYLLQAVVFLVWRNMLPRAWWFAMKLKVHGTLLLTGLLAGSGGFAGVEEHALDSSLLVTEISPLLGTGGNLEGIVLSRVSSSVANVGLARAEESARQLIACW
jgi:hypothetical protein